LPHQNRRPDQLENITRGAYVLKDTDGQPDAVIMATGSEVGLAMKAAEQLSQSGNSVRVVSMPNPGLFLEQDQAYRDSVLPVDIKARVSIEAGVTSGWASLVGDQGRSIGVDSFGASAPAEQLFEHFGLTVENIIQAVHESMSAND
jgi:transketolase